MQEKETDSREMFRSMPVPKALAKMAVPTVIGQMIILIYNLADTFFIGRTGNPYMIAAASLILPVFNFSNAISNFLGIGGGSLISRLLGADQKESAEKVSAFVFWAGLAVSAVYVLTVWIFLNPFLRLLGASENTFAYARAYAMMVVVIGGIPTILSVTLSQLLRAVGCSRQAGFGISMGGLLNIFLDPLFMFVILPDGQEVLGAGIATMLSNLTAFLYFLVVTLRLRKSTVLRLTPGLGMPEKKQIASFLSVGIPSGISNLLFDISQIMINKLMSGYGDIALASIGIVLKAERIPLNIGIGISQGMMPIVAYNYASGDWQRMRKTVSAARLAGLVMAALSICLYEVSADGIMRIFIDDAQTAALGASFLRVRCLATPFMFLCFHMVYVFQSVGRGKTAFLLAVFRQLIMYVPLLFLLRALMGMYGLVWAQLVGDCITAAVSYVCYGKFLKETGLKKTQQ